MARFMIDKYGVLEMQRAEYLKTGMIVSQTPLSAEFTADKPCENGMWVDANKANGEIKLVNDDTAIYGIVYTTEKDFTGWNGVELNNLCEWAISWLLSNDGWSTFALSWNNEELTSFELLL